MSADETDLDSTNRVLSQTQQPPMPTNAAIAAARRAGPTLTLEKLNAQSGDPNEKEVKQRIRAWQTGGGNDKPEVNSPVRHEPQRVPSPKKQIVAEVVRRAESPTKSPVKKEFDLIHDEETGKVQGIKIITPTKPAKPVTPKSGPTVYDAEKKAWVRRKTSKPQNDIQEDVMHAGLPKKRVVSDGHWRKDTSQGKTQEAVKAQAVVEELKPCLLYTSPSPRDGLLSRMPSSA